MKHKRPAEDASIRSTPPAPLIQRHVRFVAYGLLLSGFVCLFQMGTEIASQGKLVIEITVLNLIAGLGLLKYSRFWLIFTLFNTAFYVLTHIIILPLILSFLLKAEHYPQLLWIGGAEHPSASWFYITFIYEFAVCLFFIYTFTLMLHKKVRACFLPLTKVSPLPRFTKEFLFGAFAGLLTIAFGYAIQKTGWLESSPDSLDTDVLYSSAGKQLRPGPDGIFRIPSTPEHYYGLLASDTTPDGVSFWSEVQITVKEGVPAYCKTIRYIPSLLTVEKHLTLLPPGKNFYLERYSGYLKPEQTAGGQRFREFHIFHDNN